MKGLQPTLFNVASPPVKNVPAVPSREDKERVFAEQLRESGPMAGKPITVTQCPHCKQPYLSISYHLLRVCRADWEGGLHLAPVVQSTPATQAQSDSPVGLENPSSPEGSPLCQIEAPIKEPSETMPGVYKRETVIPGVYELVTPERSDNSPAEHYPYKSKGLPDAEAMHPSRWVAPPAPKERPPHWWHWVKKVSHEKCCGQRSSSIVTFTPSLMARKRSIPSIACGLYSAVWAAALSYQSWQNAAPEHLKTCKTFHEADKAKIETHIKLLVFCDLDNERVRHIARGWWSVVLADGRLPQWRLVAAKQLRLLGYELADKEPDGSFESGVVSFAEAEAEGTKG